jgi:hypothetical protein
MAMITKSPGVNQHTILHSLYSECCLCKTEARVKDIEELLEGWREAYHSLLESYTEEKRNAKSRAENQALTIAYLDASNEALVQKAMTLGYALDGKLRELRHAYQRVNELEDHQRYTEALLKLKIDQLKAETDVLKRRLDELKPGD